MSQKTEELTNRNGWCDVKISNFFGFQYKKVLHHVDLQEIRFLEFQKCIEAYLCNLFVKHCDKTQLFKPFSEFKYYTSMSFLPL